MATRTFQPAEAGTVRLVFSFRLFGIPCYVVIHVKLRAGVAPTSAQLANIAETADTWMTEYMLVALSKDLLYLQVEATDVATVTGGQHVVSHGTAVIGSVDSPALPSQNAAMVSISTATRGQSYRGRSYFPGVPISDLDPDVGEMVTAASNQIVTKYNVLWASLMNDIGVDVVVLSRVHAKVKRAVAIATPVTGAQSNTAIETMRRRGFSKHKRT